MAKTNEIIKDSVIVCTPFGNDTGHVKYFMSCMKLNEECKKQGIKINFVFKMGSSLITHGRNDFVNDFLVNSNAENLIFIDSDINFMDSTQYIIDWVKNKEYFVSGTYPTKHFNYDKMQVLLDKGLKNFEDIEKAGLDYTCSVKDSSKIKVKNKRVLMDRVGTGFMFISRKLLNDMIKNADTFPDFYNFKKYNLKDHKDKIGYTFFDTMLLENNQIGEDYAFCERLKYMNVDIEVEPHIKLNHIGSHEFKGELVKKFNL